MDLRTMASSTFSLERLHSVMTELALPARFAVGVLNAALEFITNLLGRIMGSRLVRRHFHLLLSGLVLCGPALALWVSKYCIFANGNNYLYRKFLKSVCGWTVLLSSSFILLLSTSSHCSLSLSLRHLSRVVVLAFLWLGCGKVLTLLEDAAGSCYEPVSLGVDTHSVSSSSLLLLHEDQTKFSCLRANLQWRGYQVSQEVLVLCLCSLLLVEETSVFGLHLAQVKRTQKPLDVSLRIIFLLCVVLLLIWIFLLLCLLAYFPEFPSQQLGGALGYLGWRALYRGWYRLGSSWWCPGLPGELLTSKDNRKAE